MFRCHMSRTHHFLSCFAKPVLAFASVLVLTLSTAGCGSSDPVAEVRELQEKGQFQASIEPLRALLETHSDDPEVHYLYGVALTATGLPTQAQWSFRKALTSDEWRAKAALQLARGGSMTGNHDAAIANATLVLELEPENLDALLLRTHARVQSRRDYEGALADAELVLEIDPENSVALSLKGVSLFGLERVEEGREVVEELELRFREENLGMEDTARYCVTRGIFLNENSEAEAAEAQFDDCLESFPARGVVVDAAVSFHDDHKRYARSLEILRAALEEAPFSIYRRVVAERLSAAGDDEGAEQVLLEGTELELPEAVLAAWVYLAHHYLDRGEMEKGVSALENALAAGGARDSQLQFDHAEALIMAGRLDEAESAAQELTLPAYRELILGRVEFERRNPKQALVHFSEGLRLWPNSAGARYYAALAAERAGDFDRAIAEYRYSIRADPAATDARLRLARLHAAEGAITLALTTARQGTGRHPGDAEAEMLAIGVAARTGRMQDVRGYMSKLKEKPWLRPHAVAVAAEGVREGFGARSAVRFIVDAKLDLQQPVNAVVLRELVLCAAELETAVEALASVEKTLAAAPESAALHEIRGLALFLTGAEAAQVRAAYERSLELTPEYAPALLGLARVAAAQGESEEALELFARATAADPSSPDAQREAIALLVSLERAAAAEEQLGQFLEAHPYDADAAVALARYRLAAGGQTDEVLELAQRATRFRGGAAAYDLLSEVYQSRGEVELAAEASGRAAELRQSDSAAEAAVDPPAEAPQG
jgi:tetratricopeptide (TPR) repeat protein